MPMSEPGPLIVFSRTARGSLTDCYGTRLIPEGTITGAHFVQTSDFVQVTGVGDFTNITIPDGDTGGEVNPHGADGNGADIRPMLKK
ncbi:hypothetical protein BDZ89DRAFT_1141886 [Hymenopellis radicata]|nr:hypothetical protein BDZ89DRAFT_1141886 [Hymenopellis radicata]